MTYDTLGLARARSILVEGHSPLHAEKRTRYNLSYHGYRRRDYILTCAIVTMMRENFRAFARPSHRIAQAFYHMAVTICTVGPQQWLNTPDRLHRLGHLPENCLGRDL